MSGDRGLRWPQPLRAQLAAALLVALLSALALIAARSGWVLSVRSPDRAGGRLAGADAADERGRASAGGPRARVCSARCCRALLSRPSRRPERPRAQPCPGFCGQLRRRGRAGLLEIARARNAHHRGRLRRLAGPARGDPPPSFPPTASPTTRAGMQEWYTNGPFGLEQGFTVQRPAAASQQGGVYTVTMALSSTAAVSLGADGHSLLVRAPSGGTLRYGGLRATDAANRLLPSWLSLRGGTVSLHVRTAGAHFPVSIDPLLTGEGLAIELGEAPGEAPEKPEFGWSVALSGDGTTAVVGAPDGESHTGAAWIFHREGAVWSQQGGKQTGPGAGEEGVCEGEEAGEEGEEPASCAFGSSVALSKDGNTALIGAPHRGSKAGVAWVLNRSGSTWKREEEPLGGATEAGQQNFGFSVALSADGNHALVGAPRRARRTRCGVRVRTHRSVLDRRHLAGSERRGRGRPPRLQRGTVRGRSGGDRRCPPRCPPQRHRLRLRTHRQQMGTERQSPDGQRRER